MINFEIKYNKYKKKYLEIKNNNLINNKQKGGNYIDKKYNAAGLIFTDNKHVLSGFQVGYKKNYFSGIGGCKDKLDNNDAKKTAIREMLEELFGIDIIKLPEESAEIITLNLELFNNISCLIKSSMLNNNSVSKIKNQIDNYLKNIKTPEQIKQIENENEKIQNLINQIYLIEIDKYIYYNNSYLNFIYDFEKLKEILKIIKDNNFESKYYDDIPDNIFDLISKRKKIKNGEVQELALLPVQKNLLIDPYFINDIEELLEPTNINPLVTPLNIVDDLLTFDYIEDNPVTEEKKEEDI